MNICIILGLLLSASLTGDLRAKTKKRRKKLAHGFVLHTSRLVSLLEMADNIAFHDLQGHDPVYKKYWEENYPGKIKTSYWQKYREVREKFFPQVKTQSFPLISPHPDETHDLFAWSFYTQTNVKNALEELKNLDPSDQAFLESFFTELESHLKKELSDVTLFSNQATRIKKEMRKKGLRRHLKLLSRLFKAPKKWRFFNVIVWHPSQKEVPPVRNGHALLWRLNPTRANSFERPESLAREASLYFLSLLSAEQKQAIGGVYTQNCALKNSQKTPAYFEDPLSIATGVLLYQHKRKKKKTPPYPKLNREPRVQLLAYGFLPGLSHAIKKKQTILGDLVKDLAIPCTLIQQMN